MSFLRNVWYVSAWDDEVGRSLLGRKILEEAVVFYRREDGTPVAMTDRCPHRFAPLSKGRLLGDAIECAYHGLQFDCSGQCTLNPHGDGKIPSKAVVKTYPVVERYGLIWIWMGDAADADPSMIPEFEFLTDPQFQNVKGYTLADGHYELMTDNIMDLGHIEFLHPGLLGSDAVRRAKTEIIQSGNTVYSNRLTENEILPPVLQKWYEVGDKRCQRWLNVRWDPAATMKLTVGVLPTGEPKENAHESQGCHLMTPATLTSTHYFWAQGRNWGQPNPDMDALRLQSLRTAFDTQDKPMIEAVQNNMGTTDLDSLSPVMLSTDGGPVRARRVLKQLLLEESKAA